MLKIKILQLSIVPFYTYKTELLDKSLKLKETLQSLEFIPYYVIK